MRSQKARASAELELRRREARATLDSYRDRPREFNEEILGRHLWPKQIEVCDAVSRSPVTVVPAGRAVGKSFLLAGLTLWWLYTREHSLVVTTGPDHRQVVSVLFKELRRAMRGRRDPDGKVWPSVTLPYVHLTQGYASPQRLEVVPGNDWCAIGFAAGTQEGFSGQHQGEFLVIVDEASGIHESIWEAIDGLLPQRLVVSGNPIKYDCRFRELHDLAVGGSPNICTIPISCLDHPHAELERSPVGAVSASFLRQMRELHGENSPWWSSNIAGLFPGQESVRFIPSVWLDACVNPEVLNDPLWLDYPAGMPMLSVDVGGGVGADKSVILVRDRKRLLEVFSSEWHGVLDSDDPRHRRLEPEVVRLAKKWGIPGSRILYDQGGIGRSFGSYLAAHGLPDSIGYFGSGRGGIYFKNRRTACAYALRKRLDPARDSHVTFYCGGIPEWPRLRQELSELRTPITELDEGVFKEALETKEELMDRIKRSPDVLDSLLISFSYLD